MDSFFLADWNMNLYRGCCHGCIYCDSRSACYHLDHFSTVRPKENALGLLEQELRSKRRSGIVTMGAMSDPYNPLEERLLLTQGALTLLLHGGFGAAFTTKSPLCARDAALLHDISVHAPVCARLTITCASDALCSKIEPHVAPSSQRLKVLNTLSKAGVYAGAWIAPVLPYITDQPSNMRLLLTMAADAGAKFAICEFGMTLRTGNREYYYAALEREFPGVRAKYLAAYGNDYFCPSPQAEELCACFEETCDALGLRRTYRAVNEGMMATQPIQLSLPLE